MKIHTVQNQVICHHYGNHRDHIEESFLNLKQVCTCVTKVCTRTFSLRWEGEGAELETIHNLFDFQN